ncbi:MAG: hypothetical protein QXS81_05065 [Candidatus Micrarchaeaceae archaeon]
MADINDIIAEFNTAQQEQQEKENKITIPIPSESKKSRHVNFLLEPENYQKLTAIAISKGVNVSQLLRDLIIQYIAESEKNASRTNK